MTDYRETVPHGSAGFPVAFYSINHEHLRYQMSFHWHPEHELLYVKSGKLHLTLNQNEYDAAAGDMFFIQGGTFHMGTAREECEYDCLVFSLDGMLPSSYACRDFCENMAADLVRVNEYLGNSADRLHGLFRSVAEQFEKGADIPGYELNVTGLILRIIGEIIGNELYRTVSQPTVYTVKTLSAMRNVLYRIESGYSGPLTLEELAMTANLSPNYFCRLFKRMTSRSPIDYLIAYRVDMAEFMLRSTDRSITDIALSCGFNDVSHFIKYFKREKGITPKKYKLLNQGKHL